MNRKTGLFVFASVCLLLQAVLGTGFIMPVTSGAGNPQETADDWPMFGHDLMHTGYSMSKAPDTNKTLWKYRTGHFPGAPAVVDGVVFVGSYDNKTYALNASTGDEIWSRKLGGNVWHSPAVAYGMVFVNCGDNRTYALDAATGELVWSYETGDEAYCAPVVADGKVYIGSSDGNVYALDAATGELVWSYETGDYRVVGSSPAVAYGMVFIAASKTRFPPQPRAPAKVYALNASTGAKIWSYMIDDQVFCSPAVAEGKVYIGSNDANVYALDAYTGNKLWSYQTGRLVQSDPAVAYGLVFIGSGDNRTYALNATTGELIWNYTTGDGVHSAPAVADGKVFFGSLDKTIYALNASTGELIWSYETDGWVFQLAIAYGKLFVSSADYNVYCFGEGEVLAPEEGGGGFPLWAFWIIAGVAVAAIAGLFVAMAKVTYKTEN